ncbi:hypothetical protein [Stenotrophomonas sp. PS02289]|uniref:hypothetical protein n=1 Tax=Stenotrophomonas sp. PS02289 TaxID=2991422 RepID=UPI00249A999E|nr:hypothetical protein [Stenotrophomonas sp. PS02289]
MRANGTPTSGAILLSLSIAALCTADTALSQVPNAAGKPASQMEASEREQVERLLNAKLQRAADGQPKLPGQTNIVIATHLSVNERTLLIDLGRDAVPDKSGAASERQCHELSTEAISILNGTVSVNEFSCTYDGKDIHHYHPDPPTIK